MIGFFQNSMAKHHRLVFGVLLVFIVVSFVFYTGSGSAADLLGIRRSATVLGVDLRNSEETAPYRAGVLLANGGSRYSAQDLVQRIYMVKTAEAYRIPEPTQAQLSAYLSEQGFSPEVIESIKRNYDISEDVLRTTIIHSWKLQQFMQTFGNVPSVFEADVELAWKEINTKWKADFAKLSPLAVSLSVVEPTEEQITEFYEKNKEDYRIAELVKLSYAKIVPANDAVANVPEPTEFELTAFVSQKFDGNSEKATTDLADNRASRIAEWKNSQALDSLAAELSNKLYEKLPTDMTNPRDGTFADSLKKSGFEFTDIAAFPRNEIPAETGLPAEILRSVAAGGLNDTLWRTDAIPVDGAVYVVVFRGTEPSRVPVLEEVRGRVVTAWQMENREEQFLAIAREKGEKLRRALASGVDFALAASTEGFSVETPDAFSPQSVPEEFRGADLIGIFKNLPEGELSSMIRCGNDVCFAKVVSKDIPAIDKNSEEFKNVWTLFDRQTSWETFRVQIFEGMSGLMAELGINEEE